MTATRLPYPGLRAFTRDESDLFFGRDGCVDAMVNRLAATRFLAVLGASGSGKSSLVRTGLLDALTLGLHPWAGTQWTVADFHPGGQPMRNLAAALLASQSGTSPDATSVDLLAEFLRRGPRSVAEWVAGGNLQPGRNLLLLVDQFEELFRYGNYASQEEAEAFVALLLETAAVDGLSIHVVITMRSEYLGACALMPGLAERINAGLYLTPRMTREECREAIEGPAAVTGFVVERPLVNRLLNDLSSFAPWEAGDAADQAERLARRADQLPLMQHVLNRLWARAVQEGDGTGVALRLGDYDGLGGLSGALDVHGSEVLAALGDGRAAAAQMVFESLVSGATVADAVRRPCKASELVEVVGNRDDVVAIVEAFSAPDCNFLRLSEPVFTDRAIVDISHESLIRQWTPLRQWLLNEARNAAAWRRLLAAEERYTAGEGGRLTGLDLGGLVAWWASASPTAAWAKRHGGRFEAVQAFIETSQQAEAAQIDADDRRRLRERKRLQFGVAGLAIALAIASGFAILAQRQQRALETTNVELEATKQRAEERSRNATAAEALALQQRDAATAAKEEAEAATQRAEEMAAVASARGNQLTQAAAAIDAGEIDKARNIVRTDRERSISSDNQALGRTDVSTLNVPMVPAGRAGGAASSNADRVTAARTTFNQAATAANLSALETAVEGLYDEQVKLKRPRDAEALYEALIADAERLLVQQPDPASYRTAWSIFLGYGDRIKATDRVKAGQAFTRSLELSERLPDVSLDRYRRLVSYERMGDQELAEGRVESASGWFAKQQDIGRQRFTEDRTVDTLNSLRIAGERLYGTLVTLKRQADADRLLGELVAAAEQLLALRSDVASNRLAWGILIKQGDGVKARDRAAARRPFERSVELAELLTYASEDLHRRLVSYERVGDLESADGKTDAANQWFSREVNAARGKYALDATAENLGSLKIAADRLRGTLTTLKRQAEASTLQRELVETAEALVKKSPDAAAYAAAWDILTDQGESLRTSDPVAARRAYARSAELADLLADNAGANLAKRVFSYDRLGDNDFVGGRFDAASEWFAKTFDTARRRYALDPTADSLRSLRLAMKRQYDLSAKLPRPAAIVDAQSALFAAAEDLSKRSSADGPVSEIILAYTEAADYATRSGDRAQSQRDLARADVSAQNLRSNTADGVYGRYQVFNAIADAYRAQGSPADARARYLEAATAMDAYLRTFATAAPPRKAAADNRTLASSYGSLSFMYLLAGSFPRSIEAAQQGLEIEPDAGWIEANLAHGLLLTGREQEAVEHYTKVRKGMLNPKQSLLAATAEDFDILKRLGFTHEMMDPILKQMAQD